MVKHYLPVHGIPQKRLLEWVAISFSRGSSDPEGSSPFTFGDLLSNFLYPTSSPVFWTLTFLDCIKGTCPLACSYIWPEGNAKVGGKISQGISSSAFFYDLHCVSSYFPLTSLGYTSPMLELSLSTVYSFPFLLPKC